MQNLLQRTEICTKKQTNLFIVVCLLPSLKSKARKHQLKQQKIFLSAFLDIYPKFITKTQITPKPKFITNSMTQ